MTNISVFEPNDKNPEGSLRRDLGIISYDKNIKLFLFWQFHTEGYVI